MKGVTRTFENNFYSARGQECSKNHQEYSELRRKLIKQKLTVAINILSPRQMNYTLPQTIFGRQF